MMHSVLLYGVMGLAEKNNGPLKGVKPSFVTVPLERVLTEVVFGESAF